MRKNPKPAPKSRRVVPEKKTAKQANLGDTDTSDSDVIDSSNDSYQDGFQTPEPEDDATDYGLEFTTSNQTRVFSPRRCSTARATLKPTLQSVAPSSTSKRNEIPKQQGTRKSKTTADPQAKQKPGRERKQRTPLQLEMLFWKEVKRLQESEKCLAPRLPFSRLVREIIQNQSTEVDRITVQALEALQQATEMYVTQRMQDAYMLTLHRGRVTLSLKDLELINFLRVNNSN